TCDGHARCEGSIVADGDTCTQMSLPVTPPPSDSDSLAESESGSKDMTAVNAADASQKLRFPVPSVATAVLLLNQSQTRPRDSFTLSRAPREDEIRMRSCGWVACRTRTKSFRITSTPKTARNTECL
ncbi:hypothetical protein CBL_07899, partial [Carabus blaptoides fortunei]